MEDIQAPSPPRPVRLQDRTTALLALAAGCRTVAARQAIEQDVVVLNLGLADGIAATYRGRGMDAEDLIQVGRVGLVKAVQGYRADMGTTFAAYARPTIAGEIKRHFRDHAWAVRPPRHSQELRLRLTALEPDLWQRLHRRPDRDEMAEALGVPKGELTGALLAGNSYTACSLDAPEFHGGATPLADGLADERDDFAAVDLVESLRPAVMRLTARERRILRMRYAGSCTQEEIGLALGISQMQVSRLLVSILARLRAHLVDPELAPRRAS